MQADEKCRNGRETQETLKTSQETPAVATTVSETDYAEGARMTPLLTGKTINHSWLETQNSPKKRATYGRKS